MLSETSKQVALDLGSLMD